MRLTGKAKEQFEDWYLDLIRRERKDYDKFSDKQVLAKFYRLLPSQKWGVYQDWADSIGYTLSVDHFEMQNCFLFDIWDGKEYQYDNINHKTRQEARNAAIDKLNELINK